MLRRFDLNARVKLFNAYWSMLVKGNLSVKKKKHTYKSWIPAPSGGLKDDGYNIRVCQRLFVESLAISATAVRTAFEK